MNVQDVPGKLSTMNGKTLARGGVVLVHATNNRPWMLFLKIEELVAAAK